MRGRAAVLLSVGTTLLAGVALMVGWAARADAATSYEVTSTQCRVCHDGSRLAPGLPEGIVAQRPWQRAYGMGYSVWTKGQDDRGVKGTPVYTGPRRGRHGPADLSTCRDCHQPDTPDETTYCDFCHKAKKRQGHVWKPGTPTYPPSAFASPGVIKSGDCASGCHVWMPRGATVSVQGFVNASGDPSQTTYSGPVAPGELLGNGSTAHTENWGQGTCVSRCHGGSGESPSPVHGTVTLCRECHNYGNFASTEEPVNIHDTHVPLVQAEIPLADPANTGGVACSYCHYRGTADGPPEPARTSCWNCHLSGHNPIVPYWKAGTPPLPLA